MRILIGLLVLLICCLSCAKKKAVAKKQNGSQYSYQKVEAEINNQSFDSTVVIKGNKVRLKCNTECFDNFSIADTLNDSTINLYQDRFLKFTLTSNQIEKQVVVTKELIKAVYNNNSTYKNSVLAFPRIEKVDPVANSVLIHSLFLYPNSLDGTNFLEEIIFELTTDGKVVFKQVMLPPAEPDSLTTKNVE